jgi:high-affinity iron transporter
MTKHEWKRRGPQAAGKPFLAVTAVAATIGLAACGDSSDETSTEAEASVTPAVAIEEIAAVEDGLAAAVAAYQKGDADQAEELASTAYLEHFELVEGPLEEADEELNEHLEELIREELRTAITDGATVAEVKKLVAEANDGLDEARTTLKQVQ